MFSGGVQRIRLLSGSLTILLLSAYGAQGQSVDLAWDPGYNAAGYRLYSGTTSGVYTQVVDVGNVTSTQVSNLVVGQIYFFAVKAYNTSGLESAPSNEISYVGGAPTPTPTPTPPIQVTVRTNQLGRSFSVDGTTHTATRTFFWQPGSSHTIATTSPQSGDAGVRHVWKNWSSSGAISHTVAPTTNETYTANFRTQYFLTMSAGTGGTVTPDNGWKHSGLTVLITAKPATGYSFSGWIGSGAGSFSGTSNPASVRMRGPITEMATFAANPSLTPTPIPTPTSTPTPTPTP